MAHKSSGPELAAARLDKPLHAITFIPQTGNKIQCASSSIYAKPLGRESDIIFSFSKQYFYENPLKK